MAKTSLTSKAKSQILNLRVWVSENKFEFFLLLVVLVVASFMRLYQISDYMTFLGDEGRDVIIVGRFIRNGDIMLIGPGTSIGNMYLGPLYYYMMAPALLLSGNSPVGPAVMVALLGVVTVFLVWLCCRDWFGKKAAILGAALYAISPTVIIYSHSSWNPNIMPFFALLSIWGIWKVWNEKKYYWLSVVGVCVAAALQSHYLGLLLVPVLGIFWLFGVYESKKLGKIKEYLLNSFFALVLFLLLMSPLVIFDVRHNFMNFNALKAFFTERQTTVSIKPWKALPGMWPQLTQITTRLVGGFDLQFGNWIALGVVASAFLLVGKNKLSSWSKDRKGVLLVLVWLVVGLLGLALYKQQIYDHYYGFLFPAPFILLAAVFGYLLKLGRVRGMWIVTVVMILLVWISLKASPLQYEPNRQLPRSQDVSQAILKEANSKNFNFAVIAERNYEGAYQYFLQDAPNFRVIDPQNTKDTIADQLFVVCELSTEKCDPTHNAKAEVANFGWSKIENTWNIDGVTIFKLVHSIPPPTTTPAPSKKI